MELNSKYLEILKYLVQSDEYIKIEELAQMYNVTDRSMRYSVDKIEKFLVKNGFKYLDRRHNKGIKIIKQDGLEEFVNSFIKQPVPYKYSYSKEERFKFIITKIIQSDAPVKISELQKILYVSKNTILKELDEIEKWLGNKNLNLIRKQKIGISIEGNEYDKRKALLELIANTVSTDDILNYVNSKITNTRAKNMQLDILFSDINIDFLDNLIRKAEAKLGRRFSDDAYGSLLTHLAIMIKRVQLNKTIYLSVISFNDEDYDIENEVANFMIKEIENYYNIVVPKEEIRYIIYHLSGARVYRESIEKFDEENGDELINVLKKMINEIEILYNVDFEEQEDKLLHGLVMHIRPAIFRIKFNKILDNPLYFDIKNKYYQLFSDIKYVSRHLEEFIGRTINEHELSYIVMHFGAALENVKANRKKSKVIVVCGTGIGTARMVSSQLKNEFNVEIVDTLSAREIDKLNEYKFDVIVSTVDIKNLDDNDYIKINPIILKNDYEKLEKYFKRKYQIKNKDNDIDIVNRVINIVEKYCTIQDKQHLKYELLYEIKKAKNTLTMGRRVYMLSDLLTREMIRIDVEAKDWEEAIREGTKVLRQNNYVEDCYEEAIINNIKSMGPYMVVAPGIVLSHARPENGVNKLSMSLTLLKNPVVFGHETNDPVKIVITVAAIDNETHLKALSQLMELMMNEEDMKKIFNANNKDEIVKIVNKYQD